MAAAPAGANQPLTFTREGTGTLFYTARLRYAIDQFFSQGLDVGFKVERRYELFEGAGARRRPSFTAGDLVRVTLTFQLPKERRFVAVTDPLPAGFEAVESWFETTKSSLRAADVAVRRTIAGPGWRRNWGVGYFDHIERHDDRLQLFATSLSEGSHTFSYVVRATTRARSARRRRAWKRCIRRRFSGAPRARRSRCDGEDLGSWLGLAVRRGRSVRVAGARRRRCCCGCVSDRLPDGLLDEPEPSTIVVDRHGVQLYEARSGDGTRTVTLTAASLPPTLVAATIAAEDRRFWSHPGVDPIAILRAAKTNLLERSVVEGGSTITQQVAKLLLNRQTPSRTRGWSAKVHEALIALRLEHRFTKRELLAMYLNLAGYGNQVSGVERASQAVLRRRHLQC